MTPILYSFRRCPYAMRARMALKAASIAVDHREVVLRDKPQTLLDISPKGTVPVLQTARDQVFDESLDIMHWALSQNDALGWLNGNVAEMQTLISDNDGPFKYHLDRYKYASRYEADRARGDMNETHKKAAEVLLSRLNTRLKTTDFLLGDSQSLADIAIFPFVRQFANADKEDWDANSFTNLRNWLSRHVTSDLFKSIMSKHDPWTGQAPV